VLAGADCAVGLISDLAGLSGLLLIGIVQGSIGRIYAKVKDHRVGMTYSPPHWDEVVYVHRRKSAARLGCR